MVKICHLSTVHQRRDVRIVYKECASLAQSGYNVHLIIADGLPDEQFLGIKIHGSHKYPNRFLRVLLSPLRVLLKALPLRAEVYHFHDMELLPAGLVLRALGRKVIYDVHDNLPKQIMGKHYVPKPLRHLLASGVNLLESSLSRGMSAIVTADSNKETRFRHYHRLVRTVHNYPLLGELSLLKEGQRDPRGICYIGGITRIRGIFQLLDAMRNLNVKLILAGAFEPPNLDLACSRHPSWAKVIYKSYLDREGVADVLSTASIGMVTLLPNDNYLDSLPIKMFEYMSAALPVVASDFPDWRAIVERYGCGLCVDPTQPDEIARAIETLLADPVRARQMGERGREGILRDLNWESQANLLIGLYKEVLQP